MEYTCHSGGCDGADMYWETEGNKHGVHTIAYSFPGHTQYGENPYVMDVDELYEGWQHILLTEPTLKRNVKTVEFNPYIRNLLSRNWFQVKYATEI